MLNVWEIYEKHLGITDWINEVKKKNHSRGIFI